MADIELVIKIPEWVIDKDDYTNYLGCMSEKLYETLKNGTPLPKGHGRLIEAKAYENNIRNHYFDNRTVIRCTEIALENTPTIIEADKE